MPEDCIKLQRDTGPPLCSAFLLTPHLCIQTLRVVTLLHSSIIHNTAVSHLSGFFIIIIIFFVVVVVVVQARSLTQTLFSTFPGRILPVNIIRLCLTDVRLAVIGASLV